MDTALNMKTILLPTRFLPFVLVLAQVGQISAADIPLPTAEIEHLTGLKGKWFESERVFKITRPRRDVPIAIDGRVLPPFMGFTSWAAFTPGQKSPAMLMGDIVLFEDEVDEAMSAALDAGLQVTALHNHFLYDEPKVLFMHISGEGEALALARGVRAILDRIDTTRTIKEQDDIQRTTTSQPKRRSGAPDLPRSSAITASSLESLFGDKGTTQDGMVKFVWGRTAKMQCGCEVGREMGVNTWAAFYGTDTNCAVCGDFVVLESDLQATLRELRHHGISVVAIHHHMTGESPRLLFLHYWGRGLAGDLASALKAALALQTK